MRHLTTEPGQGYLLMVRSWSGGNTAFTLDWSTPTSAYGPMAELGCSTSLLQLSMKAFLEGPFNEGTSLMKDDLRSSGIIPLSHPYAEAPFGHGGDETMEEDVLQITGANAIVDRVLLELRDANAPSTVRASRAALIQRNGDITDVDGVSPVSFAEAPGPYKIVLRHRNHLGVMTNEAFQFDPNSVVAADLSLPSTSTYGTQARTEKSGVMLLWKGDGNSDGNVSYTGVGNDRDKILMTVGGWIPTNIVAGYDNADLDLDGVVKYAGTDSDRDLILDSIGGVIPTNVREEQLP